MIIFVWHKDMIEKILKLLGLPACAGTEDRWRIKTRPPHRPNALPKHELSIHDSSSPLLGSDTWLYVDPEYPETYAG